MQSLPTPEELRRYTAMLAGEIPADPGVVLPTPDQLLDYLADAGEQIEHQLPVDGPPLEETLRAFCGALVDESAKLIGAQVADRRDRVDGMYEAMTVRMRQRREGKK